MDLKTLVVSLHALRLPDTDLRYVNVPLLLLLLLLWNLRFLLLLVSIWSIIGGSPREIANSVLLAVYRFRFPVYFADVIVRKRYIVELF